MSSPRLRGSCFSTKGIAMQMISEVMTRDVMFVSPQESLQRAAQMMDDLNVGVLPVCDGERLVGMITDRDITVRSTSAGAAPENTHVEDAMSSDVRWCFEDQSLDEVMQQMGSVQIRRVPVVSHDDAHRLVGIVALGDLATKPRDEAAKQEVEQVVEKVSWPSEPDRSAQPQGADFKASGPAGGAAAAAAGGMGPSPEGPNAPTGNPASVAPDKGTSAGPGSTQSAGAAAGTTLGAAATGAGGARTAGGTGGGPSTNAPARNAADAAGGPSTPAGSAGVTGGTDAAGTSGASGGTAGTAGSSGSGGGPKP
jgi:CBS domain-containing protein